MERTWLSFWDVLLPPIHLVIIFFISYIIKKRNIEKDERFKYFQSALFIKIAGGIIFGLIYSFYYFGGDTTNYYECAVYMKNLAFKDFWVFLDIMLGNLTPENYSAFDYNTGFPVYYNDPLTYAVVRFSSVVVFFSFNSFFSMTIFYASFAFIGSWRLFQLFSNLYPHLTKKFAFAILYFPSLIFWGSGILKDSITLMAACWFAYSFYYVFIGKKEIVKNSIWIVIMASLMILIKPYIFIALMPGTLFWLIGEKLKGITNWFIKLIFGPVLIISISVLGIFLMQQMSESFGQYSSIDNVVNKAVATQQDLKQEYYQGNSFDIGEYDATLIGVLSKFPEAVMAGLFRPYLWDVRNVVMLISGIENTFLLLFSIYVLYRCGLVSFFKNISLTPILFFSLIFSVFFAFSVGFSTSNFGALVRYKIPSIPFLVSALVILNDIANKKIESAKNYRFSQKK